MAKFVEVQWSAVQCVFVFRTCARVSNTSSTFIFLINFLTFWGQNKWVTTSGYEASRHVTWRDVMQHSANQIKQNTSQRHFPLVSPASHIIHFRNPEHATAMSWHHYLFFLASPPHGHLCFYSHFKCKNILEHPVTSSVSTVGPIIGRRADMVGHSRTWWVSGVLLYVSAFLWFKWWIVYRL